MKAGVGSAPLEGLTTSALAHSWQLHRRVAAAGTDAATRAVAEEEGERCLEELETRDPVGVCRWLAAGADVADPAAFLDVEDPTS